MYVNIFELSKEWYPFNIVIGGRGTGKTYGALKDLLITNERFFVWMRRTAVEMEMLCDTDKGEGASDLKEINRIENTNYGFRMINKKIAGIYNRDSEDGKYCYDDIKGYGVALSNIASIRGMNFSECCECVYDEFIPESHIKKIKNEGRALLNAYETMNRNREFNGDKPIRLWLLANSDNIYNEVFKELDIVHVCEKMLLKGKEHKYIKNRGLAIHIIRNNNDFVEKKSKTALYKLTSGSEFSSMALDNSFAYNDFNFVKKFDLKGFQPIVSFGIGTIYRKKGEKLLYISYSNAKTIKLNINNQSDLMLFKRNYHNLLYENFRNGNIYFESIELKEIILDIIL